MPEPIAVPAFTVMESPSGPNWVRCSPSAIAFASFSTTAGTPKLSARASCTGNPAQPGIRDGNRTVPPGCTGPGSASPTPASSPSVGWSRRSAAREPSTCSGPSATVRGELVERSSRPARSATPSRAWLPPSSATSRCPGGRLRRSLRRGRPPPDATSPSSTTTPASMSCPTQAEAVDGATRSRRAMSERDEADPSASSSVMRGCGRAMD